MYKNNNGFQNLKIKKRGKFKKEKKKTPQKCKSPM